MTGLTLRDRMLAQTARWILRPILTLPLPWRVHRAGIAMVVTPRPRRWGCSDAWTTIAGLPAFVISPPDPRGTLLWMHGGGFVLGSPSMYRRLGHALAGRTGLRVVLPRYRLAPEHPFPAALEDAIAVADTLARDGAWWLGGDSAGGTLALSTLAETLTRGLRPERVVLVSPAPDLNPVRDMPRIDGEILLTETMLRRAVVDYLGASDPADPRASPVHADFTGAPPILIQCASGEVLEDDIDELTRRIRSQGVEVELQKAEGLPHDYQVFAGLAPAADRAVAAMANFLGGLE